MSTASLTPPLPRLHRAEVGQCKVRLGIVMVGLAWYLFWFFRNESPSAVRVLPIMAAYFVYAIFHLYWTRSRPDFNRPRMLLVTFCDQALVIYFLYVSEELGLIYVFASPWISIGNGLRFGSKWMSLSASVAVGGLALTGLTSAYWQHNLILLMGLLILNLTIPAYVAVLLAGLERSRAKLLGYAQQLEKMALKDALTGLPNRTALYEELYRVCAFAGRHQLAVVVLYFDLDGFKHVNDSYGHAVGDALLQESARRVQAILRGEDILARLGGDEFVVLLHGQDSVTRATPIAHRILRSLRAIDRIDGHRIRISASLGGIVTPGRAAAARSAEALLHEADSNMYQAKREGKDRIILTGLDGHTGFPVAQTRARSAVGGKHARPRGHP